MQDRTSFVRHALLGAVNGLKLSTAALRIPMSISEQAEFLDDILVAADELLALLDEFEALPTVTTAG